jgi:hypothetical protein
MSKSPSPGLNINAFVKFLRDIFPLLVLAGLIACGGGGSTSSHVINGGGGSGGGGGARGASSLLFAADFNALPPPVWCPTDSDNNIASITTLRIWDSQEKWSDVETSDGTFDFSKMDNTINNLVTNPGCTMGVIYTVGSIPQWATACNGQPDPSPCLPGPTTSGFGGGTECANSTDYSCIPPSDVNGDGTGADAQFQNYINTLATRYGSKIAYYEVWNEADSPNFWCPSGGGSPTTCGTGNASLAIMVRMGWDLYNIVHCASSSVKVLSPSFHGDTALTWMSSYVNTSVSAPAGSIGSCSWPAATVTGLQTFDITNFHGRPGGNSNPNPTLFLGIYNEVVQEINTDHLPTASGLFDDENGYLGTADAPNPDVQAGYVAISYVLRASVGPYPIALSGWYAWDAPQGPLQGSIAGLSYDVVAGWLSGSSLSSCTILGTVYSCLGTSKGGKPFDITWDMGQSCVSACTTQDQIVSSYSTYTDLTGAQNSISGGTAPVGYKPILLE